MAVLTMAVLTMAVLTMTVLTMTALEPSATTLGYSALSIYSLLGAYSTHSLGAGGPLPRRQG